MPRTISKSTSPSGNNTGQMFQFNSSVGSGSSTCGGVYPHNSGSGGTSPNATSSSAQIDFLQLPR